MTVTPEIIEKPLTREAHRAGRARRQLGAHGAPYGDDEKVARGKRRKQ